MWIDHPAVLFYAVTKHKVWCIAYIIGQYVVLSSGRKVIFGKWKNLQSPCGHCYRPQTNEESVTSNKGQKWQLNRSVGISTCIWNICMCMCNCAIVHWQCTMAKPACAHDDERQRNVLCHQNVFSTKQTRYCCRAALHLYPFLVFSNENSTSFFFWNQSKSSCQTALIESAGTICDTWKALSLPVRLSTPSRFRSKTL